MANIQGNDTSNSVVSGTSDNDSIIINANASYGTDITDS